MLPCLSQGSGQRRLDDVCGDARFSASLLFIQRRAHEHGYLWSAKLNNPRESLAQRLLTHWYEDPVLVLTFALVHSCRQKVGFDTQNGGCAVLHMHLHPLPPEAHHPAAIIWFAHPAPGEKDLRT